MKYIVYKVTNDINGKFYIGTHKTNNINDGYMGSGKYLKYSQNKHGIENFTKEILFVYDNPSEMFAKEAEIVDDEFIAEQNTYNIKRGGSGGFDYINSTGLNGASINGTKGVIVQRLLQSNDTEWATKKSAKISDSLKRQHAEGMRPHFPPHTVGEFTHTAATKQIMSDKAKERLKDPTKNSSYGTCWIHSLEEQVSKKIKKDNLDEWLDNGWVQGRKMKF